LAILFYLNVSQSNHLNNFARTTCGVGTNLLNFGWARKKSHFPSASRCCCMLIL